MQSNAFRGALSALALSLSSFAIGCSEDVGECFDPDGPDGGMRGGEDTVIVGGSHVEYGGQAILNRACAQGCHNSQAKGEARRGAPAGLDFDLNPVEASADTPTRTNSSGRTVAVLEAAAINGLKERQRKVVSERNRIWQQVKDGLMPPDGMFASFKKLMGIAESAEDSPCTAGAPFQDIDAKSSQDVLRNWLACESPIIEAYGGPITEYGVAGPAGHQYAACGDEEPVGDGGAGDGGGMMSNAVTFEDIYEDIFEMTLCTGCHPSVDDSVDLSDVDKAYADLVTDKSAKCNGKPYVTAGNPGMSFLYEIVATEPACSMRMPIGGELSASQLKRISDWITQGALRAADVSPSRVPPMLGGLDAGVN